MIKTIKYFLNITKKSEYTTKLYMNRFDIKRVRVRKDGKLFTVYDITEEQINRFKEFVELLKENRSVCYSRARKNNTRNRVET